MKWIGLTGGIATGKSAVSEILRSRGFKVIDADLIAREVVTKGSLGIASVVARFGSHILQPDGSLDRKKLGELVFSKPADLRDLEAILHPLIQNRVREERKKLAKAKVQLAFYDLPLLFEKNLQDPFDATLVVWCKPEQQVERLIKRDRLDLTQAKVRIAAQMPILEKIKRATWSIDNSKDLGFLEQEIDRVLAEIKK